MCQILNQRGPVWLENKGLQGKLQKQSLLKEKNATQAYMEPFSSILVCR